MLCYFIPCYVMLRCVNNSLLAMATAVSIRDQFPSSNMNSKTASSSFKNSFRNKTK